MSRTSSSDDLVDAAIDWIEGIAALFLDPFGILQPASVGSAAYRSEVFTLSSPSTCIRTLEAVDDFHPGIERPKHSSDALPKGVIRFEPPQLTSEQRSFRVRVKAADASGHPGGTYWGSVRVKDAAAGDGNAPGIFASGESVRVWIVIP